MPRRRTVTLAVSGALLVAFGLGAYLAPVPYAEMTPGPTFDTLGAYQGTPLITVSGHPTFTTRGQLRMVTVGVSGQDYQMPLGTALVGWLNNDEAIVPKETIYPPGQSQQQADTQNAVEFTDSQNAAVTAALSTLGIKPTGTDVVVAAVAAGTPADGKLQAGDVIVSVNGATIAPSGDAGAAQVQSAIKKLTSGRPVSFLVFRAGRQREVTTGTRNVAGHAVVGISLESENVFPFQVNIQLNGVGGPSAGLMFALGIIDKLTAQDITGGRVVAGTGTIDADGNVGAIGGIQMKTIGARRDGATVFLAPAGNCADAKANLPAGLELVKVSTLQDAVNALADIRAGKTPPTC